MLRKNYIDSLRKMADFIEQNEDVPTPDCHDYNSILSWHGLDKDGLATIARSAAKFGMKVDKQYFPNSFQLSIGDVDGVRFSAYVSRNVVCRAVETDEVEEYKTYPDDVEMITKTRPKVEWVCDEPLLKKDD